MLPSLANRSGYSSGSSTISRSDRTASLSPPTLSNPGASAPQLAPVPGACDDEGPPATRAVKSAIGTITTTVYVKCWARDSQWPGHSSRLSPSASAQLQRSPHLPIYGERSTYLLQRPCPVCPSAQWAAGALCPWPGGAPPWQQTRPRLRPSGQSSGHSGHDQGQQGRPKRQRQQPLHTRADVDVAARPGPGVPPGSERWQLPSRGRSNHALCHLAAGCRVAPPSTQVMCNPATQHMLHSRQTIYMPRLHSVVATRRTLPEGAPSHKHDCPPCPSESQPHLGRNRGHAMC